MCAKCRQYCFSGIPRKPNIVRSLLTALKWYIHMQHSTHQALIRPRHLQPFRFEVSDFFLGWVFFPLSVSTGKFLVRWSWRER